MGSWWLGGLLGIRQVFAGYTPGIRPNRSQNRTGGGPHQRARRSNANVKLTAIADPQSCSKDSEEPPQIIEELRPLPKKSVPMPTTDLYYAIPAIAKPLSRNKHVVEKVYARGLRHIYIGDKNICSIGIRQGLRLIYIYIYIYR